MLKSISVSNFALIENMQVEFGAGLNVITGETGAGKSVLISAINLALGGRADKSSVRTGCDSLRVEAVFDVANDEAVFSALRDLGIEPEDTLIICRRVTLDGRNDIRINGVSATLAMLKSVTTHLVDIYGQHEHQALLYSNTHIRFLDKFLGENLASVKQKLGELLSSRHALLEKIKGLGGDELSREREREMLEYQVHELENANLQLGEEEELINKKARMENAQRISEALASARELLSTMPSGSICDNAHMATKLVSSVEAYDPELAEIVTRLDSMKIEADDIADTLEQKLNECEYNEFDFREVDTRLDLIKSFKRKYGSTIAEMLEYLANCQSRLLELEDTEALLGEYSASLNKVENSINEVCTCITDIRRSGAIKLQLAILSQLKELGMSNATFEVAFSSITPQSDGADAVEFMFSANAGEPLKPLIKVISGGEMSRFMLAFKVVMGKLKSVDTMIFDEIDNGISGVVSIAVGQKMAMLSKHAQVITVTHLATIASFADSHFQIVKCVNGGKTNSTLVPLDYDGQLCEIARLAGGDNGSALGLAHAQELKTNALKFSAGLK